MNPALPNPQQPGKWLSAALTVLTHVLLGLFLFYGVHWQSRPPETVTVDLVSSLPPMPRAQPAPQPKITPPPPPPPQPKAQPTPEPPKPVAKPDIELKAPKEKPKPKVEPQPEPKPESKPEPKPEKKPEQKPRTESSAPVAPSYADRLNQMMNQDAERARLDSLARADAARAANAASSARATGASKDWSDRIRAVIRPNIVLPPGVNGRPKPVFLITLMPDGTILSQHLTHSSGIKQVDDAVENAIIKTAKLPKPTDPNVFQRQLELIFDPYAPSN